MRTRFHKHIQKLILANDATEDVSLLLKLRLPWLIVGLAVGAVITYVVAQFEDVLASQVSLAFFIPIIVYMSDAVGTQTETIYVRNLNLPQAKFSTYLVKELLLGLMIGAIAGGLVAAFAWVWLDSATIAATVGLAMTASISAAAVFAIIVPTALHRLAKIDPAVGAGPFTTVLQDLISLLIYFFIASAIIL